jgi:hypothetical protein
MTGLRSSAAESLLAFAIVSIGFAVGIELREQKDAAAATPGSTDGFGDNALAARGSPGLIESIKKVEELLRQFKPVLPAVKQALPYFTKGLDVLRDGLPATESSDTTEATAPKPFKPGEFKPATVTPLVARPLPLPAVVNDTTAASTCLNGNCPCNVRSETSDQDAAPVTRSAT